VGGLWLGGGSVHRTVTDEIDPRSLNGSDSAQLCLPDVASQPIAISAPRLLLELDDGTNLLDRDTQARLAEAFDGRPDTAAPLPQDAPSLAFERPYAIDSAFLKLANGPARALGMDAAPRGRVTLEPESALVSELALTGSPVGAASPPSPRI